MSSRSKALTAALLLGLFAAGHPVLADEGDLQEAQRLLEAGNGAAAEALLRELIASYPRRPEPYNNLAALYAEAGRLEEARRLLEQALRADPAYAAVYDNLGALNLAIARRAYARALPLEGEEQLRLSRLEQMALPPAPLQLAQADEAVDVAPKAAEVSAVSEAPVVVEPPLMQAAAEVVEPEIVEAPNPPEAEATPVEQEARVTEVVADTVSAPVAVEAMNEVPSAPVDEAEPVVAEKPLVDDTAQVRAVLEAWATAWSEQTVAGYLAAYSADFPSADEHAAWAVERRRKLTAPDWIRIELSDWQIRPRDEGMRVELLQRYTSDRYRDLTQKRFDLVREEGGWRIAAERTLKILE